MKRNGRWNKKDLLYTVIYSVLLSKEYEKVVGERRELLMKKTI